MTSQYTIQASFNRGEASPLLGSRVDTDLFKASLQWCENFQPLLQGGIRRRSGTVFVREVKSSASASRLFPFTFSNEQSYVLDFNASGYIRFYANRGVLGAPYEVAHSYGADISELTYTQFNDLAYFAHADYAPAKLSRLGDTSWTLGNATFKDGPYLPENTTATYLTPANTGRINPIMTSNTTPSGTASKAGMGTDAYKAFDGSANEAANETGQTGTLAYDFSGTATKVADAYWIMADESAPETTPTNWTFDGYDGTNWITLDTRRSETGWVGGESRYFTFPNKVAYQSYRLKWTSVDGGSESYVAELVIHESGDTQTPFNLTASSTTGINDGSGFLASDVGRTIRLLGADGKWRWAVIAAHTSSTVVTIRLYGHALLDTAPITRWALGAYSDYSGYPALVTLYDGRLMWGRTDDQPLTVAGSKSVDLEDYGFSDPLLATDAINITLLSKSMNELNFLSGDEDLVAGSAKQIRIIGPDDINLGVSATNVRQRKGPNSGAAPIEPLSIGGTTLYVGAGGRKVRELVMGDQNRYVAPELSITSEHLLAGGIVGWLFSENPEPIVYIWTGDGALVSMLYDREQRAVAFSRITLGGDGFVESAAVIPSQEDGFDDIYLVVRRTINGGTKRYVEVLERPFDYENDAVEDGFFVDCGLTYDSTPATVISGLSHLEGEEVVALADGGVVDGLTVTSGSITLPYAASKVHVGLAYRSLARTLPFAGPGQDGILFGRRVQPITVIADVLATGSLEVGAAGDGSYQPDPFEINPHLGDAMAGFGVELMSAFQRCDIEGSWAQGYGRIEMSTSKPLPALVRSVILQTESEP